MNITRKELKKDSSLSLSTFGKAGLALLVTALLVLGLSSPVLAAVVKIPFTDTRWKFTDQEALRGTTYEVLSANNSQIHADGDDVWTGDDEYGALYLQDVDGEFTARVRINSQEDTNSWAKTGIMVKENMGDSGGATGYVIAAITPDNGYAFQWDSNSNGFLDQNTNTGGSPDSSYPSWVRLKKEFVDAVAGVTRYKYSMSYRIPPGRWTNLDDVTITASDRQDLGIFVTSHSGSELSTVVFRKFYLDGTIATEPAVDPPTQYTITATAGANGTVVFDSGVTVINTTSGVSVVEDGSEILFVTADLGYEVDQILVDSGVTNLTGGQYTFSGVTMDHTFNATFTQSSNQVTATTGSNGSISPSGGVTVFYGNDQTFTVTPSGGYEVDAVTVDGSAATLTGTQYTFTNVTAAHTINVTFKANVNDITASAGSNGSLSPSGTITVSQNGSQIFTATPNSGYVVDTVLVDGGNSALDANNQYTFSNVVADHTISVTFSLEGEQTTTDIPGCDSSTTANYSEGFDAANFDMSGTTVENGRIELQTGQQAINPESVVIPFQQEVSVTFLYEGAGYVSDFGYVVKEDALVSGTTNQYKTWNNIPTSDRQAIFHNIYDDDETGGCCGGGDGVFDTAYGNGSFPKTNETSLATYNDGTGLNFTVDGDGSVTPKDMKKVLGTFAAGTELVFFLTANKDWDTNDTSGVFFNKKDMNPDTYTACGSGTFDKTYNLGDAVSEGGCQSVSTGWLASPAISRMSTYFGVTLSGTYVLQITKGQKYDHVIVGAPPDDPDQWILGWEDLMGAGDADHNDMVFRIERQTGGVAELKSEQAITPTNTEAYYTAISLEVYDNMPCSGDTTITYYLSIDNGENWVEITNWDVIKSYTFSGTEKVIGDAVTDWTPGSPALTYRTVRIDFAARGLSGRELIWKAEMFSENDSCIPQVVDVVLEGSVATHGSFSRASPVVQANVIYSGSYETPAVSWGDKKLRGHLKATRLYLPENPNNTNSNVIWDAGAALNSQGPGGRTVYIPDITIFGVTDEVLDTGDGSTKAFSGLLANFPVEATTLSITDQTETFVDKHTDMLVGNFGGTGTINRFTGEYNLTFDTAPGSGVPIKASYSYYTTTSTLLAFTPANVTNAMLGLDNTFILPDGYTYDFDNDNDYDEADGDWLVNWIKGYSDGSSTAKEWLLGAVDHSVPAVMTPPPPTPAWYFGTAITDSERTTYDTFASGVTDRQTTVFVGARDGMVHAFDGGEFRWGDNPNTTIEENRGYYEWTNSSDQNTADYGDGSELWAFIPANLIARLKNNALQGDDQAYVDASPAIADVFVNSAWRTVLLCAEGNGGDSVFALDVTDPNNPTFLWEFADPDLFRSRSSPAVAQIGRILVGGQTKWTAFFVSGKTFDTTLYPSIYMIDIANGSVIQRYFLDAEVAGVGGVPSGQPAIVDSDGNGYIDRVYIGTDKGRLYKVNMPDDPDVLRFSLSHCVINDDFTDDDGNVVPTDQRFHPIYASPAVVVQNTFSDAGEIQYDIRVFFGTGDNPFFDEDINTASTNYFFFAYRDEDEKGECGDEFLDWFFQLPTGHRVWTSAFAAAGNIYFGTSTAETEDPCTATETGSNQGIIYAFSIEGGSPLHSAQVGNVTVSPVVDDQHLYYKTSAGLTSLGSGQYNNETSYGGTASANIRTWRLVF